MKSMAEQQSQWEELAGEDARWAVLARPDRKHGGWERDEFFATGEEQVAEVLDHAARFDRPRRYGAALDFGSGVGRLTRALAARFDRVVGVDIAQTMVETATRENADLGNVEFVLNDRPDLSLFEDDAFDMVNTRIVLQHQPSREIVESYIAEFLRVLRPEGLLVFQLPSHLPLPTRLMPRRRAYVLLRRLGFSPKTLYWKLGLHPNRMLAVPTEDVVAFLEAQGATVLDVVTRTDPDVQDFREGVYYVTA